MAKKKKRWYAKKGGLPRNLSWMHDFDYFDQLTEEEQDWMDQFIQEYYDGKVKKGDYDALHCLDDMRKECYGNKNRQNRDLLSIMDCRGKMRRIEIKDEE